MNRPLALLLLLLSGCRPAAEEALFTAVPVESFSESATGPALREPPEGAVAVGAETFRYAAGAEEAARAGRERVNPFAPTAANLERGRKVYTAFCAVCHGEAGVGDGPVVPPMPRPPSLGSTRARELPDGQLFHVITFGQGRMAPHGPQLAPEDRWKAALRVRELQPAAEQ